MAKNQPKRADSVLGGTVIRNAFGIQSKTLAGRNVKAKNNQGEPLAYCLYDVVDKCGDLISKHMQNKIDTNGLLDKALRVEKTKQEIRKLRIDNESRESKLVNAIDVEIAITNGYRAIADSLSSFSEEFHRQNPDITAQQLASIENILNEVIDKIRDKCN